MRAIWGAAALVLVAGCSSGTTEHKAAPAPKPTRAAPKLDSAAAIGKVIGCRTPLRLDSASMAQEERYCKVGSHLVSIVRAPDRETLRAYAKMGESFGATVAAVNDQWAVSSLSRGVVVRLAKQHQWRMI